jgi:hypothetical protein
MAKQKPQVGPTLKRLFWICAGLALIVLGVLRQNINGEALALWRRLLVIAGGLFFLYCDSMYYFPKYRRRRGELDRVLDETERELGASDSK